VHVIKSCPTDFLIGTDYLCRFPNLTFSWSHKKLNLGKCHIVMENDIYIGENLRGIIRLNDNYRLEPYHSFFIKTNIPIEYTKFQDLIFEPFDEFLGKKHMSIATALVSPSSENTIPINIINPNKECITIYKNTKIGQLRLYRKPICKQSMSIEKTQLSIHKVDLVTMLYLEIQT